TERDAIERVRELAVNVEAVLRDHAPRRLGLYERTNGVVFSELLELYGYLLNRLDEPVPVLPAPASAYLAVSRHTFSVRTGHFVIEPPSGPPEYGAILGIKEYADATWPGILNGLKYLGFEYVLAQSFSPKGRHAALRALE